MMTDAPQGSLPALCIRLLEKWYGAAAEWIHPVPGEPELAYYGTGEHATWSIQANSTAFAAMAVMACAPDLDESVVGSSQAAVRARALELLRYLLATHKSGRIPCVSGEPWGHSWISVLGLERMSHAVATLRPWLSESDLAALRRVTISECDFLLDGYPTVGAIDAATGHNKPESNIWNASMLYRTAALYPDTPHATKYREKGAELILNGISIPSDATSETVFSGKPLREWHVGPNFTEQYGLHHHGYLNVGYMMICLSNIAMFHYACLDDRLEPPPELYHHAEALWQLVKSLTFDDGRLWRIGGDTRVRYCYCQDYSIPVWVLARDLWGDTDADRLLSGWIKQVSLEQQGNPGGGFLSSRLASLTATSPLYYCRLEGDRAATLSMAAYWLRKAETRPRNTPIAPMDAWSDAFHGAAMVRGKRLASWVWKAAQLPTGTVVPADRSDMAEWQWNLAGRIKGTGCNTSTKLIEYQVAPFPGGFISSGSYHWVAKENPAEGTTSEHVACARTICVALPDDSTVVILQRATSLQPVYLNEVAGLHLNMPNDLYNSGERTYRIGGSEHKIAGAGGKCPPKAETIPCGEQLEIEGRMSVQAIYGGTLSLYRPGKRLVNLSNNTPLHYSGEGANLYCDLICLPYKAGLQFYEKGVALYDIGAVVAIDAEPKATLASDAAGKLIKVYGADGHPYLLAANLGFHPVTVTLPSEATGAEILSAPSQMGEDQTTGDVALAPGETALIRLRTSF